MKKILSIVITACIALAMGSCSDENEPARTPVATVSVDKTNLVINESMEIRFTGVADQVVVFTGDADHEYQEYGAGTEKTSTGLVVNKGLLTYSYSVPGTFHVVVIASTYDTYSGGNRQDAKYEFDVTVTDDCTTLDQVYSSITPNIYYAQLVNDQDWVLCLPSKQVYKGKEVALNAKKQRLSFDIQSDSTKVFVNDAEHTAKAYYDFTAVNNIHVVAHSGKTRDYRLYGIIYPEFSTITIGGVKATLERDAYNQDRLTYKASGINGLSAEFTVDKDVQLQADGVTVTSPVQIDKNKTYTLVRTNADNPAVKAVSQVAFVIE